LEIKRTIVVYKISEVITNNVVEGDIMKQYWEVLGFQSVYEYMGWKFMNGEETAADEIMSNNPEFGQINKEQQSEVGVIYEAV
tara:strand:- start:10102 stop:10350 length:249 start_codon:yes stop_codon:yes gene_type:complete